MSNKWIHVEGQKWVEKRIITPEQYKEIIRLYPVGQTRFAQMLPIFASILIGLSLLTFVASNWGIIPQLGKLSVLFLTLISFYTSGFFMFRQGHVWVGKGLLVLGVISFGASMILIGQMFQLIAYDARLFVFWSLAGLGLLYLYQERIFYFLTAILILAGQVYSLTTFNEPSWTLIGLTIVGLGSFAYRKEQKMLGYILAPLIGLQSILVITSGGLPWAWIYLIPVGLYTVGLSLSERALAAGFLNSAPAFGYIFSTLMVFLHQDTYKHSSFLAKPTPYLILFFSLTLLGIMKAKGQRGAWLPFILFLPLFYLPFGDHAYLVAMFAYSSFLMFYGDQDNDRFKSNIGVFLFMMCSLVGYVQLAWRFLDKSLFFLVGGLILFFIHWILRKRKSWLMKGEEKR